MNTVREKAWNYISKMTKRKKVNTMEQWNAIFLKFKVTKSALILYAVFSFINKIDVVKKHQLINNN